MSIRSKTVALSELPALVPERATVALGGAWFANHPMAAVRELVRAGRTDVSGIALLGSIDVDLLVGAGALADLTFSMVTMEAMGMAANFRRAVQSGELAITEVSAISLQLALEAAGRGVPFLPLAGPEGSDLVPLHPEVYGRASTSFGDEDVPAVRAIRPDVAIVHASRCDELGNAQFDGTYGQDPELARAASRVIVTCEEIVSGERIAESAELTRIPGFLVDAVVEAPFGAHPCSHVPRYAMDAWELLDYQEAASDPEAFARYLDRVRGETEDEYRARAVSGDRGQVLSALVEAATVLER
ncbi:CoA transferase subunit A [Amycolatopsis rubida]|uniref:CoA transferase subunit A n=1 Tax=Amycolatopsis rubida TaxID=112413 RepID=A0A1I5SK36_9PSEU|nr:MULTISPECIES: CoA-transferase [Amycolatopsis]MYW97376.1 CoA transferase subunit A [Amycolatopsis rubida]NEC62361.1 CoA transferase subunit A [Amycolatopsis rubida]OAP22793.1 3-oxoadipate CoA-transferase subunit A [Amycolatopsis sp. M39]SFP70736.1 glutaconate CoA-transferase subunit A [Amycolatopsis rubida]